MADSKATERRSAYYIYLVPGVLGFLAIVLTPFLMNLALSFTTWKGVGIPKFVGLQNYARLLQDEAFWGSLLHTAYFIVAMAIIPTVISLFLAALLFDYISTRFGASMSSFFRASIYLPQILPVAVAGILWGWLLNPNGVANAVLDSMGLEDWSQNWLGDPRFAMGAVMIMMIWLQLGYSLVVFMAGLARVDPALYEASELDGAGWFQRFWYVTIPMLKPEIFVVGLTTTIAALKVFAPVYVLTSGGPDNATLVPGFFSYYHFFQTNRVGYGAAITTAQTLLIIVLGATFLRQQAKQTEEASA